MPVKRQKPNNADQITVIDSQECVTFDALLDSDYPIDLISENLQRMLSYEPARGLGEIACLVVRSAGCTAKFELQLDSRGAMSASQVSDTADRIETECLRSECPAAYPLQKTALQKRMAQIVQAAVSNLIEGANYTVLGMCSNLLSAMSTAKLQSLRFAATAVIGMALAAAAAAADVADVDDDGDTEIAGIRSTLAAALSERCADVAVAVRKRAVTDSVQTEDLSRALNDPAGPVRAAAVRALGAVHDEDIAARVEEMAVSDTELAVRRASLRYLVANSKELTIATATFVPLLYDEDEPCRKLAADLVVASFGGARGKTDGSKTPALLVMLANIDGLNQTAALALATALEKVRSEFKAEWPQTIAWVLAKDYEKEAKKAPANKRAELRALAKDLAKERTRLGLLELLDATILNHNPGDSSVIEEAITIARKFQHDPVLENRVLTVFSHLPFEAMKKWSSLEPFVTDIVEFCKTLFMERGGNRMAIESLGAVFAALPENKVWHTLEDLHQDLRIKLAELLGPRGEFPQSRAAKVHAVVTQLIVLGRCIDISDLANLPLWTSFNKGDTYMLQLVRALGLKGDAAMVKTIVHKLANRTAGAAVDDVLRVLVSAKLRDISIDFDIPVDLNETGPASDTVWRSAVAAGVI